MNPDTIVRRLPGFVEASVEDEIVGLHVEKGTFFRLNVTASSVWALANEPRTVGELLAALLLEYDVEPEFCRKELWSMLEEMQGHGMLELSSPSGS